MHRKLKLVAFHRKQKHVDEINVQINGTKIERVESFNFLGIMLDKNLTWKSQKKHNKLGITTVGSSRS